MDFESCYSFNGKNALYVEPKSPPSIVSISGFNVAGTDYLVREGLDNGSYLLYSENEDVIYPYAKDGNFTKVNDVWQGDNFHFEFKSLFGGIEKYSDSPREYHRPYFKEFKINEEGTLDILIKNEYTKDEFPIPLNYYLAENDFFKFSISKIDINVEDVDDPPSVKEGKSTSINITEGESVSIDLNDFFYDPEDAVLTYIVDKMPDSLVLEGNYIKGTLDKTADIKLIVVDHPNTSLYTSKREGDVAKNYKIPATLRVIVSGKTESSSSGGALSVLYLIFLLSIGFFRNRTIYAWLLLNQTDKYRDNVS
ncbi:hypothetical protein [Neptunicella marina]|uniref:Uncharacterized protein n=1 Tax=Neptunicella marina TaxID=2125989 RepID=A0A8J6IYU6_9ALTE|nr:hypothetical protein [Neptunicella marina]MBC3767685.1 hypothetical protein [Neptunicella marina]